MLLDVSNPLQFAAEASHMLHRVFPEEGAGKALGYLHGV
jgi:hypothetical protein